MISLRSNSLASESSQPVQGPRHPPMARSARRRAHRIDNVAEAEKFSSVPTPSTSSARTAGRAPLRLKIAPAVKNDYENISRVHQVVFYPDANFLTAPFLRMDRTLCLIQVRFFQSFSYLKPQVQFLSALNTCILTCSFFLDHLQE